MAVPRLRLHGAPADRQPSSATQRGRRRDHRHGRYINQRSKNSMGKIVVTEFVSLDGVMEAPGGGDDFKHAGWTFKINRGEEGDQFKLDETRATEALLLGRVTYEGFAAA